MIPKRIFLAESQSILSQQLIQDLVQNQFQVRVAVGNALIGPKPQPNVERVLFSLQEASFDSKIFSACETVIYPRLVGSDAIFREIEFIKSMILGGVKRVIRIEEMNLKNVSQGRFIDSDAEKMIQSLGRLDWVFLRTNFFMQTLASYAETVKEKNSMYTVSEGQPINFVDADDVALAICEIIKRDIRGQKFIFTGTNPVTYNQLATSLSGALGRNVLNSDVKRAELVQAMKKKQIPEEAIEIMEDTFNFVLSGEAGIKSDDLQKLGINPKTPDDYFKYTIHSFK